MSIADIIKSIECGAFREIQPHKIGGRNGEPIDCSTLEDEPVIVADNETDRQSLRACFKEWIEMKTLIDFIKNLKSFYRLYKDYEYNGAECEFIIENYQEVLCSRTKTMSKPTYYAGDVISQIDDWYDCHSDHAEWPRISFYWLSEEI